jgi:tetratricopeptide (TPR) repeat protein
MVGLTDIEINYNRPSKRDRVIFGSLVPFGKLWRTGANSSTKISFSTDVEIEGSNITKGTYSVFSIPNEESWDFILYSDAELWGVPQDWDDNKIIHKSNHESHFLNSDNELETFTISINNISNNDAIIVIGWGDRYIEVSVDVPSREMVDSNINNIMSNSPKATDYYAAAVYYRQENIKLNIALEWINKAMEMTESPRFFQLRQQSLIMAANGNYNDAIKVAEKSLELSIKADNQDYVKMNNDSIEEWSKK